jgi:hypothetical protein
MVAAWQSEQGALLLLLLGPGVAVHERRVRLCGWAYKHEGQGWAYKEEGQNRVATK